MNINQHPILLHPPLCSLDVISSALCVRVVFGSLTPVACNLTRGQCPNQIYTTEELDTLDTIVFSVAKEMARVEKIAPREEWSPIFKRQVHFP